MKLRPGDQPLPKVNNALDCQMTLQARLDDDIPARRKIGIERYGTGLQPFNGRDVARDAYEEWLDLGMYIEQWRRERATLIEFLEDLATYGTDGQTPNRAAELLRGMGVELQ
jgi:hypothetical protein